MSNYNVKIHRFDSKGRKILENEKTPDSKIKEIWAEITNRETCETINRRIWWVDEDGIFHDETSDLPVEVRSAVDNAWIEKRWKW